MYDGIEASLSEKGYRIDVAVTKNRLNDEAVYLESMLKNNVSGLIIEGSRSAFPNPNLRLFEEIKKRNHFSSYDDNENYHFSFQNFTDSINESDIDKIFNRFYTTDLSRSRKTTGLGLTIAKNLTVKMGGSISASLNNNVFEIVVCFPKQKG